MLRQNLPFLKGTIYLDSASVSPAPSFVLRKMDLYHPEFPFNYGVWVFKRSERCRSEVDEARRAADQFLKGVTLLRNNGGSYD
jgi:selenocysteine lyase/cysteine desulfurase